MTQLTEEELKVLREMDFARGFLIACGITASFHDESIAYDTFAELGVSRAEVDLMDLTEFDADNLKLVLKGRVGNPFSDGRGDRKRLAVLKAALAKVGS